MSLKSILVISAVVAALMPYKAPGDMVNPDENTEDETGARDIYTSTYAMAEGQASSERKAVPMSRSSRSGQVSHKECSNYTILSSPDRARGAIMLSNPKNDSTLTTGWYRFSGDAGNQMAFSCVPRLHCGTSAPGWMNGNHPTTSGGIVQRQVCFNWNSDCCTFKINIKVRHCGHFYIYRLHSTKSIGWLRYCGNAFGPQNKTLECGGNLTSLTGQINSPGYPNYMEPISCNWTIKAPSAGKMLLYFEDIVLSHEGCSSNSIIIDANGQQQTFCRTDQNDPRSIFVIGKKMLNIYYQTTGWKMKRGFKLRYAMINGNLDNADVQDKWSISIKVNGSSAIQVSWQVFSGFLNATEYVYGYAVVCKPANQRSVYVLTGPDAATITITGLTGGTEYKVQVVALVSKYGKQTANSIYGSKIMTVNSDKGECKYYNNLTSLDRAQGSPEGGKCDLKFMASSGIVWYRFRGQAGTQMATSCVPKWRCGTEAPGWMMGTHPAVQDGIVTRTVCFHWSESCCFWHNTIKVRNCGGFYVYKMYPLSECDLRYCGNKGGCGKSINDTIGTITSPGYPKRIYWDSKCQWNFTAPSPSGAIVVIVEHLSIPITARCLVFNLTLEDSKGLQVGKACGVRRFITWVAEGYAKLRFHSNRASSRWVGFKARYLIFNSTLTNIPGLLQWPDFSAQPLNSAAITVQWGPYPASPGSPSVTEYLIICVPDGLPLNATVFTTDVSHKSLKVTGLMKYTKYTIQIVVQNSQNDFQYLGSQKIHKNTSEDVPSEGPAYISATAKGNVVMNVRWQPIPKLARNGIITHYVIYYKKAWTSENWAEMYSSKVVDENTPMTANLSGLESATEYRIQMAGVTSVGVGIKSKAVFAISGCNYVENATLKQFNSPRYPGNYFSNLDCTWRIGSEKLDVYVVFDAFHLEAGDPCPDQVLIKQADNTTKVYCGKKNPFAVKLSSEAGFVKLKTDGGMEESGFHARLFTAITDPRFNVQYDITSGRNTATMTFSLGAYKGSILEYVVLYQKGSSSDAVWNATITKTNKAVLTGLDQRAGEYYAFVLVRTTKGVYRGRKTRIKLVQPSVTPVTGKTEATEAPTINEKLGMYPYGDSAGDSLIPSTAYYSTRCFPLDIPDDGMQFFKKRHHKIHICRNGLLLFETPRLVRWPHRFSEQHHLLRNAAMLAPYWAITDVEDSFVTLGINISKVYYQEYKDTDNNWKSKTVLHQASYHVINHFNTTGDNELIANFSAKWVLKVTWVNLRYPGTTRLALTLDNTFQAVVMTDGTFSFVMYNYPSNGIQWAAPTERKYYSLYATNSLGLPVVGFNSGKHNRDVPSYYDVIGSGTPGIVNINQLDGSTVYLTKDTKVGSKKWGYTLHGSPGTWFFRLEDNIGRINYKQRCIEWYKSEPDHRKYTEHLEPCPCTYRQALWDERFGIYPEELHRICAYTVFESVHGWGQECCYERSTGALIKGFPDGGTARKKYLRGKRTMKVNGYVYCCTYSNMCHLYYKRRPTNNCDGYKPTDRSWFVGDPHFVTLDGLNYTFNGLGEYIMADISNGLFQLQARTKLVEVGGKATVFVSAVAKEKGSSAVQVNLKPGQVLEVLVNGTAIDHNTLTETTTLYNGSVALSRLDTSSITVLFPCGISVKMTNVKDSLAILLAAPEKFKNKTRGLLGVWNGDPKDDLTTPTGRVLPTDATGRTLHYEFGQKWQVTDLNSLFTYNKGQSVSTFSNPSFEPMFIEDYNFTNDAVKQDALEKCEGDLNCLFDVALTNDVTMGTSTKKVGSRLKEESEELKNSVPKFLNDSSTFYVTINTTARKEIFAKDDDSDPLTFNVSGILPENLDFNTDSGCSVVISWKVTMDKVKFKVTVMDDKGAVALLRPEVHVCACHNGGYCAPDSSNSVFADSTNDTFLIMPCTCIHGYTGRFCENDLDACQANLNPCYPGVKCTDLPPPANDSGYKCGPCPRGFTGDGATCLDLDECEGGKDGCSQVCVNTPGSFVCDCNHGYRLDIDQKTCNDIDECFPSSDCMQKCTNTDGSYTCGCDAGFKVNRNDPKKCVPKIPCTDGNHGCQHICYTKDGRQKCACHQGYKLLDDQKSCEDINECSTRKSRCNQYCHNTDGSYSCSCKKGFRMNNDGVTCVDVDECMELTYQCPNPSQICLNTAGSYKCVCGPGLYLTVNNTCREILPGHTTPSPGPAPTPKPPTDNEKDNAVRITVEELHISEWNERLEKRFKQSVAKAVTSFCASKDEECKETRKRERRALDYIPYTADQVHLLPDFPKPINLKSRHLADAIAFYVEFPPEVVSTSGDSIKGGILVDIVGSAKADIEKALNRTISSITLNKRPSTEKKPAKLNISVIIGVTLGGVLFIGIVGVLIRREINRNSTFRIKRNQEKKERRARARNVNNACYDDGIPGEFRLGPTQSTTDILEETGNEYVKTAELGIDNLEVDVK